MDEEKWKSKGVEFVELEKYVDAIEAFEKAIEIFVNGK